MTRPTVLQVGDVAGVRGILTDALAAEGSWDSASLDIPDLWAGRGRVLHAAAVPLRAARIPLRVAASLRRRPVDVMHLHWVRFAPFLPPRRPPLVVHAHGTDVRDRTRSGLGRLVMRSLRAAELVVVATPDLLEHVPSSARYLPNPVDTDFFCDTDPAGDSDPAGDTGAGRPVEILIFARLSDIKGAPVLVDAARRLLARRDDVVVRAFEGGPYTADAAAAGVQIEPRSDRAGVRAALRRADIVLGQQQLRVLGLSELEAMSVGRPVLMPLDGSFYTEPVPVVVASGAEEIVAQCERLADNPVERRTIGCDARAHVVSRHGLLRVAAEWVAVYEALS